MAEGASRGKIAKARTTFIFLYIAGNQPIKKNNKEKK